MAISFKVPKSPKKKVYQSSTFLGADFTSEASVVDDTKSPNCENMIRSVPGKIRKRMGYEEVGDYGQSIYGVHYYSTEDVWLVHAGAGLYSLNGVKGRQWEFIDGFEGATKAQLETYYAGLGYDMTVDYIECNETGIVTSYYFHDREHGQDASLGSDIPVEPPTAYSEYEYGSSGIWFDYLSIISHPLVVYRRYEFKAEAGGETILKDFVDDSETPSGIFLLDGDVANTLVGEGLAPHRSTAFELNHKLLILDGTTAWLYDRNGLNRLTDPSQEDPEGFDYSDIAYIPTTTINKDPVGQESAADVGNKSQDAVNMATAAYTNSFYVNETHGNLKVFQMDFAPLDHMEVGGEFIGSPVKVEVMDQQGEWHEKVQGTDFTVDYDEGTITFVTAPGSSPITGTDNVKITAYHTVPEYADRINHCTIGAMFGINGAHDRIFISGNPDKGDDSDGNPYTYINCDWWCWQYDPTYWPDLSYSKLGSDTSAIMGYSIINNYLAAHKDYRELTQSVIIREGDLVDDDSVFKIINSLQGAGAISKYCFSYLATEPVFLTNLGVYAITAQDITGEKYAQDRSYYLEGKLLKEENLENAFAYTWKDYYILAVNDHLYVLDGLQPMHTDRSRPYATRQYAGFYFTNIPASCFFEMNNELYFGSMDGKMYRFFSDEKALASYNDNGAPITAVWETADIDEMLFYKKKTYRYLAVRCLPEITSSIKIYAQKEGQWSEIKDDQQKLKYFTYSSLQYSKLTYSPNMTQKISATKIRLKKLDHVRFKFINDRLNEPLGINDYAVEYTQAGNVK